MNKKADTTVKHTLPIDEWPQLHEKSWIIQRIGWVLLLLFVAAGAFGLFGDGKLSSKRISAGQASCSYDHFLRYEGSSRIHFEITRAESISLTIPQQYISEMGVRSIIPQPEKSFFSENNIVYLFASTGHESSIILDCHPKTTGSVSGEITLNNTRFLLKHFIYP